MKKHIKTNVLKYAKNSNDIVLGIDIGGTFTKLGLVTYDGEILNSHVFSTQANKSYNRFEDELKFEILKLLEGLDSKYSIIAIGVGAPNANYKTGKLENPPNLNWGKRVPIQKTIHDILDLPIFITNDANAAALGQLYYGQAKGMNNFVVLTLGTGLGSGIVSNGQLVTGEYGMAGELGHVNVVSNGRQCNCGLKGCLETYASVTGIKRTVFELLSSSNKASILRTISFNDLTGKEISAAANKGDAIALQAFNITANILGSKMADTVAHLEPEAFIITGGLSQAGDLLLKPLKVSMEKALFNAYKNKIKVFISNTDSKNSVLGPAALSWQSFTTIDQANAKKRIPSSQESFFYRLQQYKNQILNLTSIF